MVDLSRIHKRFYQHPKAIKARAADPGSLSLWLLANCWCRDHRMQGFIPKEEALEMGTQSEINALLDAKLWVELPAVYQFWDWLDWNPDMVKAGTVSSAGFIVWEQLGHHTEEVRTRLAKEVEKFLDEGVAKPVIEAALQKWDQRPDARVSWLAYFVSDAIREGNTGLPAALKAARATWDLRPLAEYGYRWETPDDIPERIGAKRAKEFVRQRKIEWLDRIEASLRASTTE